MLWESLVKSKNFGFGPGTTCGRNPKKELAFKLSINIKQNMRKQLAIMVFIILASLAQILYYYPQLPDVIASHFNASGTANGWQPKRAFFAIYGGVLVLLVLVFSGSALFMDRIPYSLINLPRKDYWLAPERRDETFLFINNQMLMFGNATLLFIFIVFQLVIKENLTHQNLLSPPIMLPLLGVYILATIVWTVRFILRFRI
ncbi:MAG TPA: DUF1648 domain-containing protein [Dissulfurispiraceae bacterium]|nr:DUF1648 domain-containing protein [Dissulfurispiraceae bacterium]